MLTRKLTSPTAGLIAGLVAGLLSQQTRAMEEVVVNGSAAKAQAAETETRFQSEMKDSVHSLNEDLKATLEKELKRLQAPKLQLAIGEVPTRG